MHDAEPVSSVAGVDQPNWMETGDPLQVIDLDAPHSHVHSLDASRPTLVVGHSTRTTSHDLVGIDVALTSCDTDERPWVRVDDVTAALSSLRTIVTRNPMTCVVAAQVMRTTEGLDPTRALTVESFAYGMLQNGAEHTRWLATRSPHEATGDDGTPDVIFDREDDSLTVTFNRPDRRNAYRARTRDELVAGLELALLDDSITTVHLRGEGRSFGSGGDLSEFGTVLDGTTGHLIRSARSAAHLISRLSQNTVAHIHGPCYGAGVELSAACAEVIADRDTTLTLPEVAMGLIPGAGGTWSIARRIGRRRATWLAVSGETIDVNRALAWGLVDGVSDLVSRPGS